MPRQVDIKVCGLTTVEDARIAMDCGADFLGFVLHPASPRFVTAAALSRILDKLPGSPRGIAVFVDEKRKRVEKIASDLGLYAVQLHGDEDAREYADMSVPVWRAVRMYRGAIQPEPASWLATRYVVDAAVSGRYGGTGVRVDWCLAARFAVKFPVMLAGGLTPANVLRAIQVVKPLGVDVASGVEVSPGRKDPARVERFIRAVRRKTDD
jgi:phosphoribosylanthranilate isomerase